MVAAAGGLQGKSSQKTISAWWLDVSFHGPDGCADAWRNGGASLEDNVPLWLYASL